MVPVLPVAHLGAEFVQKTAGFFTVYMGVLWGLMDIVGGRLMPPVPGALLLHLVPSGAPRAPPAAFPPLSSTIPCPVPSALPPATLSAQRELRSQLLPLRGQSLEYALLSSPGPAFL